jgi:hypothetical protein
MRRTECVRNDPAIAVRCGDSEQLHRSSVSQNSGRPPPHQFVGLVTTVVHCSEFVLPFAIETRMNVHAASGLLSVGLRHEAGPCAVGHRYLFHNCFEEHGVVGSGHRIGGPKVDLELPWTVFGI